MTYYSYANDLCFDVFSEIEPIETDVMSTGSLIEGSKVLIDSFFDYGQNWQQDNTNTQKPLSPYGKFFDRIGLSSDATATLKQWRPFDEVEYYTRDETVADG